jgi:hypothetical protein
LERDGPDAFAAREHLRHQFEEMQLPHLEHACVGVALVAALNYGQVVPEIKAG